jgi:O-antigen/teichoic acid export membrane protein
MSRQHVVVAPGWLRPVVQVAGNQVALFLSLGVFAVVTSRTLGPAGRGMLVLFVTLSGLLVLVATIGTNTVARVRMVAAVDRVALPDYLGLAWVLLGAAAVAALCAGGPALRATHSDSGPYALVLFAAYTVASLAAVFLRDGLYAYGHAAAASRGPAVAALVQLLAFLALRDRLATALLAVLAGALVEVAYFAGRYRAAGLPLRARVRPASWRRLLRGGLPAVVVSLGQAMTIRIDRVLLGLLASTAQVGIYSVAATLSEALWLVPGSLAQVVFHRVAAGQATFRQLRAIRLLNLGLSVVGALALGLLAPWLVDRLFGPSFGAATGALRVLLVAAVAIASYQVDVACVSASDRLVRASGVTSVGFGTVLLLDMLLIPRYGLLGAAWASVAAYALMALLAALAAGRVLAAAP